MDPNLSQATPPAQNIQQPEPALVQQAVRPVVQAPLQSPQQQMQPPIITPAGKENISVITKVGNEFSSNPDIVLHPEVIAAGIEMTPAPEVVITPSAQAVGVTPVKAVTPIPQNPTLVKLPLQPEEVARINKARHKVFTNSVVWLAMLIQKVLAKQSKDIVPQKEVS